MITPSSEGILHYNLEERCILIFKVRRTQRNLNKQAMLHSPKLVILSSYHSVLFTFFHDLPPFIRPGLKLLKFNSFFVFLHESSIVSKHGIADSLVNLFSNKVTEENQEVVFALFPPYYVSYLVHSVHHIICTLDKNILFSMVIKYANI